MWKFYFELSSGFIDAYSFESLEECIDCRDSCLLDNTLIKVSKIFYENIDYGKDN